MKKTLLFFSFFCMLFSHPLNAGKGKGKGKRKTKRTIITQQKGHEPGTCPITVKQAPKTSSEILQDISKNWKSTRDNEKTLDVLGRLTNDEKGHPCFYPSPAFPTFNYWKLTPDDKINYWLLQAACRKDTPQQALICCFNGFSECWGQERAGAHTPLSIFNFEHPVSPRLAIALMRATKACPENEANEIIGGALYEFPEHERKRFLSEIKTMARLDAINQAPNKEHLFLAALQDHIKSDNASHAASSSDNPNPLNLDPACIISDMIFYDKQYDKQLENYLPKTCDRNRTLADAIANGNPYARVLNARGNEEELKAIINDPSDTIAQYAARAELLSKKTGIPHLPRLVTNFIITRPSELKKIKPLFKVANNSEKRCKEKLVELAQKNDGSLPSAIAQCMNLRMAYNDSNASCIAQIINLSQQQPSLLEDAASFFEDDKKAARTFWQIIFSKDSDGHINAQQAHAAFKLFSLNPDPNNEEQYNYLLSSIIGKHSPAFEKALTIVPHITNKEKGYNLLHVLVSAGYTPAHRPFHERVIQRAQSTCASATQTSIQKCITTSQGASPTVGQTIGDILHEGQALRLEEDLQLLAKQGYLPAEVEVILADKTARHTQELEAHLNDENEERAAHYAHALLKFFHKTIKNTSDPEQKKRLEKLFKQKCARVEARETNLPYLALFYHQINNLPRAKELASRANQYHILYNIAIAKNDCADAEQHTFTLLSKVKKGIYPQCSLKEVEKNLFYLPSAYIKHGDATQARAYIDRLNEQLLHHQYTYREIIALYDTAIQKHCSGLSAHLTQDAAKLAEQDPLFGTLYYGVKRVFQHIKTDDPKELAAVADYYLETNPEDADDIIFLSLELDSNQTQFEELQGRLQLKQGNLELARHLLCSAYEKNTTARPDYIMALFKKLIVQNTSNEGNEAAQQLLEDFAPLARGADKIYTGIMHGFLGHHTQAENILKEWPAEHNALFYRAFFLAHTSLDFTNERTIYPANLREAKRCMKKAILLAPENAEYKQLLAEIYDTLNNTRKAFPLFQQAAHLGNERALFRLAYYYTNGMNGIVPHSKTAIKYLSQMKSSETKEITKALKKILPLKAPEFWHSIPSTEIAEALQAKSHLWNERKKAQRATCSHAQSTDMIRIQCYQNPNFLHGLIKNQEQLSDAQDWLIALCNGNDLTLKCNAHIALACIYAKHHTAKEAINQLKKAFNCVERDVEAIEWHALYTICTYLLHKDEYDSPELKKFTISALYADEQNPDAISIEALNLPTLTNASKMLKQYEISTPHSLLKKNAQFALANMHYEIGSITGSAVARNRLCTQALSYLQHEEILNALTSEGKICSSNMRHTYTYATILLASLSNTHYEALSPDKKIVADRVLQLFTALVEHGDTHNYYHALSLRELTHMYGSTFLDEEKLQQTLAIAKKNKYDAPFYEAALAYQQGSFGDNCQNKEAMCLANALEINPKNIRAQKGYTFLKYIRNDKNGLTKEQNMFISLLHDTLKMQFPGKTIAELTHEEQLYLLSSTVWPVERGQAFSFSL